MADVTDELRGAIEENYRAEVEQDERLRELMKKAADGSITYEEADEAAKRIGEHSSDALKKILKEDALPDGKMYYNIAVGTVAPQLEDGYDAAAELAQAAQQRLNEQAGVGIKAIKPSPDKSAVRDFVNKICSYDAFADSAWMLGAPVVTFTKDAVTDTVKKNAEFLYESGLDLKIRRRSSGFCCEWCQKLVGVWDYPKDVPRDIYRRHAHCTCIVECDYRGGKRQNVHTKKVMTVEESDKEAEKQFAEIERKNKFALSYVNDPKKLAEHSPEEFKKILEEAGFRVTPLSGGSLKGVQFENGGGYKINFADGGIIQYHPEKRSHHKSAYYKISTGRSGTKRYDTKGNEFVK